MTNVEKTMKLAYIFIAEHKVLNNIEIPINGDHQCNYYKGKLRLGINSNRVDYYNGLSCSAIIGENGAGKTTILNFIESSYEITDSSGIIIFFDSLSLKYHICPINIDLIAENVESSIDYAIESDYRNFVNRNKIKFVKSNNLTGVEESSFISRKKSNRFIHDLSLSQYANGSQSTIIKRTNRLLNFFGDSRWFDGFERTKVNFKFKFKVSSTAYVKSLLSNESFKNNYDKDLNSIKEFINRESNFIKLKDSDFIFHTLLKNNILSILRNISQTPVIDTNKKDGFFISLVILFINNDFNIDSLNSLINKVSTNFFGDTNLILNQADSFIIATKYNNIVDTFSKVALMLERHSSKYQFNGEGEISSSDTEFIIELTHLISSLPTNISSNFSYGWNGFSTGEFAKLNIFSELFDYINNEKRKNHENHIIVMDEVDLYLHPDWQRTFFSELLNFLNSEFPKEHIQLILSTHSPIIIGDFLPEDIVSLRVNNHGKTEVVESYGFGTHITDLYLDGMHLNSTFGEHSKRVISSIIERRNTNDLTSEDRILIKKIKNKNIQKMMLGSHDKS